MIVSARVALWVSFFFSMWHLQNSQEPLLDALIGVLSKSMKNNLNSGNIFFLTGFAVGCFFSEELTSSFAQGTRQGNGDVSTYHFAALSVGTPSSLSCLFWWVLSCIGYCFLSHHLFNSKTTILNKKSHETEQHIPTNYRSLNILNLYTFETKHPRWAPPPKWNPLNLWVFTIGRFWGKSWRDPGELLGVPMPVPVCWAKPRGFGSCLINIR